VPGNADLSVGNLWGSLRDADLWDFCGVIPTGPERGRVGEIWQDAPCLSWRGGSRRAAQPHLGRREEAEACLGVLGRVVAG
jgi:hypothetical protein